MDGATTPYRTEDYLETDEDVAAYLEAAFDDGDPGLICAALGDVARSKGMTDIARRTGLRRSNLYKALSRGGRPEFNTVLQVLGALDLRLTVGHRAAPRVSRHKRQYEKA